MKKKQLLFCLSFIGLITGSFCQDNSRRVLTTGSFTGIKTYSNIEVNLIPSDVNKIIATGSSSDLIVVSIKKGNLKIRISRGDIFNQEATKIDLYFNNTLNSIKAYQGSTIKSSLRLDQTKLILFASTNSKIDLNVNLQRLDTTVGLGGKIHLSGKVVNHELYFHSGGICEAENLKTEQTNIKGTLGGYAYIKASTLLNANIVSGVLRVFGKPNKTITNKKLGGKIYSE
tara:strand:+ start:510 stop:1196 length:687 start_codon:yes stop_codon:yes gene_type:complete